MYVDPQCSDLSWAELRDRRADPFDVRNLKRHELLERVIALVGDANYRDAIVIQGVAGAGKSSFALRLCIELLDKGLSPVRIRLRDLQLDRHVQEAIPAAMRYPADRPEGKATPERSADLFRTAHLFEEAVKFGSASIAPAVLILDGWDELSVTATVPFRERLERFLEQVRAQYLTEGRDPLIRIILTGRPSLAMTETKFMRDTTRVLTLLPLPPERVDQFLRSIATAASTRRLPTTSWDEWSLNAAQVDELSRRYGDDFHRVMTSEQRHVVSSAVGILGLPLLAFITVRLVGVWNKDVGALIDNPTVLLRSLVDLTCLKAGQLARDVIELTDKARISGHRLRQLLRRTAVAISVRGEEKISFDELARRLKRADLDSEVTSQTAQHPLAELLVSYFFKGGRKELGCEFVHKAFREYLFAEEIVETLKDYGRKDIIFTEPRQPYWKDFSMTDPRFEFSRRIAALTGTRWLAPDVISHVLRLIEWEISRGDDPEPADTIHRMATAPLDAEGWRRVRDGLADLWDWWAEGVHLRPQANDIKHGTEVDLEAPFASLVIQESIDVPLAENRSGAIPRVIAVDAQLGDALFRLTAFVHTRIAYKEGWADRAKPAIETGEAPTSSRLRSESPDLQRWPQENWWATVDESRHPYQSHVRSAVLFRPSGRNSVYFENYVARINGAGWRPEGRFPSGVDGSGLDLANTTLVCSHALTGTRTCWARANFHNVHLVGHFAGHDFNNAHCWNLDASLTELEEARFTDAFLMNTNFNSASLRKVDFEGACLKNVKLQRVCLDEAIFHSAVLTNATIEDSSMQMTSMQMAELTNVKFLRVNLAETDFEGAHVANVSFRFTDLSGASFLAVMGQVEISESVVEGVKFGETTKDATPDPATGAS